MLIIAVDRPFTLENFISTCGDLLVGEGAVVGAPVNALLRVVAVASLMIWDDSTASRKIGDFAWVAIWIPPGATMRSSL